MQQRAKATPIKAIPGVDAIRAGIEAGRSNVNEYFMFHGASEEAVDVIKSCGLDPRMSSKGSMFGIGAYVAENASKSDFYAKADSAGVKCMILARVLLGEIYQTTKQLMGISRPPAMPEFKQLFDSVYAATRVEGGCVDFREYIIYERMQAVPLFMIWYKHTAKDLENREEGCKCNLCRRG